MGNYFRKFETFLERLALDNLTTRKYNKKTLYGNRCPIKLLIFFSNFNGSYHVT
jgi:hypothetical protein